MNKHKTPPIDIITRRHITDKEVITIDTFLKFRDILLKKLVVIIIIFSISIRSVSADILPVIVTSDNSFFGYLFVSAFIVIFGGFTEGPLRLFSGVMSLAMSATYFNNDMLILAMIMLFFAAVFIFNSGGDSNVSN